MDTTGPVNEVNDFFLMNRDFSNLPRKYKMSISANIYNIGHAEINCLSFIPASKVIDGQEVIGFNVMIGSISPSAASSDRARNSTPCSKDVTEKFSARTVFIHVDFLNTLI